MKTDFTFYNPTRIHFGKDSLKKLTKELGNYGPKILLAYGGGSIKKFGLYDKIVDMLKSCDKEIFEVSGIMPNPTYKKMLEGASIIRENDIDLVLAVGGGSVIDCVKGMSGAAYCPEDPWEKYYINAKPIDHKVVPIASVLTMVGTGSEMNGGSVITNEDKQIKTSYMYPAYLYPEFSILNPELTYTVPKYQMLSGIYDIMSHLFEQYFSGDDDNVSDYLIEGLLKCVVVNTKKAIINPEDYEARSNIMWASTVTLNKLCGLSKDQDWQVHNIEHQLGAYTDCAHGMGLAAISIPYYRYMMQFGLEKFAKVAVNVWNVDPKNKTTKEVAALGVDKLAEFITDSGMVTKLVDLGATKEMLPKIANTAILGGGYKSLTPQEVLNILEECFE